MHGFHQSQVANCNSATGCTKPSQTYSLAPLSYSTSSPSSSASSRLLLSCTSEYPKLERVIITTCKNLATERGLCTQCTPSNNGRGRLRSQGHVLIMAARKKLGEEDDDLPDSMAKSNGDASIISFEDTAPLTGPTSHHHSTNVSVVYTMCAFCSQ